MAQRKRTARRRNTGSYRKSSKFTRSTNRRSSASGARRAKKSAPQIVRIVIEQPQPQGPAMPFLPEQVGAVQALTTPRRNRF